MTPFIESNDILADDDALRSRADRDGYLFLRNLVDGEPILKVLPVSRALGAGGMRTDSESVEAAWISSSFALGDVLFFHSHTVHQGLPNLSGNRLRLSVDFRY